MLPRAVVFFAVRRKDDDSEDDDEPEKSSELCPCAPACYVVWLLRA